MPAWKNLPIPLSGGVDSKSDPRLVVPPRLLRCENAVFAKTSGIQKRHGYDTLSSNWRGRAPGGGSGTITDIQLVTTRQNELVTAGYGFSGSMGGGFDPTQSQGAVFSYSPSHDRWVRRGLLDNPSPSYEQVAVRISSPDAPPTVPPEKADFVEAFGYRFVAWGTASTAPTPLCEVVIFDVVTGAVVQTSKISGTSPKWAIVGGTALLFITS